MKNLRQIIRRLIAESIEQIQIIKGFRNFLQSTYQFTDTGKEHLNCAWATMKFEEWAIESGIDQKRIGAIYLIEPSRATIAMLKQRGVLNPYYSNDGEAHIAPTLDDQILDFTWRQFDSSGPHCKVTPVSQWREVYGPYGYGKGNGVSEDPFYRGKDCYYGPISTIRNTAHWITPEKYQPPLKELL